MREMLEMVISESTARTVTGKAYYICRGRSVPRRRSASRKLTWLVAAPPMKSWSRVPRMDRSSEKNVPALQYEIDER